MFKKIAVAVDGSEASQDAVPFAAKLAKRSDAALQLIHIDEHLVGKATDLSINADEDEVIAAIKKQAEDLQSQGISTTVTIKETRLGGPAHAIAAIAGDNGADLIIAGRKGHTALPGITLGSVTQRLLQVAKQPVLVLPAE